MPEGPCRRLAGAGRSAAAAGGEYRPAGMYHCSAAPAVPGRRSGSWFEWIQPRACLGKYLIIRPHIQAPIQTFRIIREQ